MRDSAPVDSDRMRTLLAHHHAWVARTWPAPPDAAACAGLAEFYTGHPDFVARYEAIRAGFANWLATAMHGYAETRLR